jgi:hypothetical protein
MTSIVKHTYMYLCKYMYNYTAVMLFSYDLQRHVNNNLIFFEDIITQFLVPSLVSIHLIISHFHYYIHGKASAISMVILL